MFGCGRHESIEKRDGHPMFSFASAYSATASAEGADLSKLIGEDTKLFVSPLYAGRLFHIVAHANAWVSLLLLFSGGKSGSVLGAGVTLLLVVSLALYALRRLRLRPRYEAEVASGSWPLGVFSYGSGDIAVKCPGFLGLGRLREVHIEASAFVKAEVVKGFCAQGGLFYCPHVVVHYLAVDATPQRIAVLTREDAVEVAKVLQSRKVGMNVPYVVA